MYGIDEFEEKPELHECSFCHNNRMCASWFDGESMEEFMCEECAKQVIKIIGEMK